MKHQSVSIIIPTYKDWARLKLCIEALDAQTYPKELFEVIIVNNDPADEPPADMALPEKFQIITEAKPGSYAARNAAVKIASGEILGFTDSDCIPDKAWIKNAVEVFQNNAWCSRVAGNVVVFPKKQSATLAEKYDRVYAFRQKMYSSAWGSCVTANMFTYKTVIDKIGPFDDSKMTWEDINWGIRANAAGYKICFAEDAIVNHPARSLTELIKKEKRLGGNNPNIGKGKAKKSRSKIFLKFIKELRPRVKEFGYIYTQGKNLSLIDKINVMFLRQYLLSIRAYEKLQVQMGKQPNRA